MSSEYITDDWEKACKQWKLEMINLNHIPFSDFSDDVNVKNTNPRTSFFLSEFVTLCKISFHSDENST